jgi:hypothetical protein
MPTLSRRKVLIAGIGTAGLAAIGVSVGVSLSPREATPSIDASAGIDLVRSRFSPLVGSEFTATTATGTFRLVLESVDELQPVHTPEDEDRFNLLFTACGDAPTSGIYTLRHPQTSDSELFLSAVGAEGQARRLQALVDRSV